MSTHPGVANQHRINQAIPLAPTTSYDYLGPYYATGNAPAFTPFLTDTSNADPEGITGIQDILLSTGLPIASLIQITALPPSTMSPQAVLPKLPYHRQLNVLYLVPLFIALGVVLGAITAVMSFKWRNRRRGLLRTSTLLPGPPYVAPENDIEDRLLVHGYPSMEQVSLIAATPSKYTVHGSRYTPKRAFTWQTLDDPRPTYTQTIIPSSDGERFTVVAEEDLFPETSPRPVGSLPHSRVSPSLPDPASGGAAVHQHTALPKPFRRSMFDILKLKGPYRPVPSTRKEYTILVLDEEPADKSATNGVRQVSSVQATFAGERQSHSRRLSLDGGFNTSDKEDAHGQFSLQGEEQDFGDASAVLPEPTLGLKEGSLSSPVRDEKVKRPRKVTPFTSESNGSPKSTIYSGDESITARKGDNTEEEKHPDIYTKAPQRRRSRTPHEKSSCDVSRRSSAPDTHASVLPLSPPSLMSPPLEKSLFFTSSLSSNASLASRMNALASANSSPLHRVDRSPELSLFPLPSSGTKSMKKLRTKRPEPPLPYPPYPKHDHARPTPQARSASADTKRRSISPGSPRPKGHSTSAAHHESTTGFWSLGSLSQTSLAIALASSSSSDVLGKVNDIVAMGYTKKRSSTGREDGKVSASLPDSVNT